MNEYVFVVVSIMQVGPSEIQLQNEQDHNHLSCLSSEDIRTELQSLSHSELLSRCIQLHTENIVLKNSTHNLRAQLAAVALRAEEEDERTVMRLTRELEKKTTELNGLRKQSHSE